jgi:hypothetical protein
VLAIVLAILTGQDNVYTVPEFTRGAVGRSWLHAGAHLVIVGAIVLPLLGWLLGSLVLFVTKQVAPRSA